MTAVVGLPLGAGPAPTPPAARATRGLVAVLASSRPLSWVNTAFPFGAAYLLAGGGLDVAFWVGVLFFLVPYNVAMYGINDVFDHESDLRNPRKGGVEGALLDRGVHRLTLAAAALSSAPFLLVLLLLGGRTSDLALAVCALAVVAYSAPGLRFKEQPFLDSITSSTHFVGPAVFGLLLAADRGASVAWDGAVTAYLIAFFLWGMGSHAFGAVQDVRADRAGGIASVATVLGARATVVFALYCYLAAGTALVLQTGPNAWSTLLVLPYVVNLVPHLAISDATCEQANAGWRRFLLLNFVTGFVVTQWMLAVAFL